MVSLFLGVDGAGILVVGVAVVFIFPLLLLVSNGGFVVVDDIVVVEEEVVVVVATGAEKVAFCLIAKK